MNEVKNWSWGVRAAGTAVACAMVACGAAEPSGQERVRDTSPAGQPASGSADGANVAGQTSETSTPNGKTAWPAARTAPEGEAFWQDFNASRYERIGDLQALLKTAVTKTPESGYLRRLYGITYFWRVAEAGRDPKFGLLELASNAASAETELTASRTADPADPWTPCFLGLVKYIFGSSTGSQTKVNEALAEFDRGIAMYPPFVTYCRALARAGEPRASEGFKLAVADFWRVIELCEPSVTAANPTAKTTAGMEQCTQRARVPHGYNGFWMSAGDVFAKAGETKIARAFYENAKLVHFADWPERGVLEDRLANVDRNAASHADSDSSNDPPLSFRSAHTCVTCHGK